MREECIKIEKNDNSYVVTYFKQFEHSYYLHLDDELKRMFNDIIKALQLQHTVRTVSIKDALKISSQKDIKIKV